VGSILFLFFSTLIASIIQSTSGFGFSIIIMALWPMMFSMVDSVWLSLFGSGIIIGHITLRNYKHVNLKIVGIPLLCSLIANLVGLSILVNVDNSIARRWLGGFLIFLSIYMFFAADKIKVSNQWVFGGIAGSLSGLMGGFLNIPGPPIVIYMAVATQEKKEYLASLQFFFLINFLLKVIYFLARTEVHSVDIQFGLSVFIASIAGVLIGTRLFERLSSIHVKNFIYGVMLLSGASYLFGK